MNRVYVFSVPVRVFHWLNVILVFILIGTGLIMGNPPAIQTGSEASFSYWFGTTRFIHFASAYLFTINFLFRMYWMFVGNKYERWRNFVPYSKAHWQDIWKVIRYDIFLKKDKQHTAIGHNAVAGASYFVLFICMLIIIITGFALYSNMSNAWFPSQFNWITSILGGEIMVRMIHHALMWVFILFTIIHVYLVFFHDYVEGHGEISSMGGGWKFIEKEFLDNQIEDEPKK